MPVPGEKRDRGRPACCESGRMVNLSRRVAVSLMVVVFLVPGLGKASASTSWPLRSNPVTGNSALGWFQAINAHDRGRLLYYVAPSAREQMAWAQPSRAWPKFKALDCSRIRVSAARAHLRCNFKELGPLAVAGNRDSFWDLYLSRLKRAWMITGYGQG